MASLRKQVAAYDAQYGRKLAKGKATQSFKGLGKSAAYRGATTKALRGGAGAAAANKAGEAAHAANQSARARVQAVHDQFKGKRGKKNDAAKSAALKEASSGLS